MIGVCVLYLCECVRVPAWMFVCGMYLSTAGSPADSVTITPSDTRWVGAWWLGFFISAAIMFMASLPFWFLPKSHPKDPTAVPQSQIDPPSPPAEEMADIAKGELLLAPREDLRARKCQYNVP